ncbi:prepilin-type N-terminal cleavage/methylation domain-containing protein [Halioglobus sp.]|nr:prepilin-type N-terminal cleavage/methylation domain-containing protein [Halioglobus sp.]
MLSIRRRQTSAASGGGFSLLEMLVALVILGLALGALYRGAAGATRNVGADEKYAYGVELARSVLANHGRVPAAGVNVGGETDGEYRWYARSSPALIPGQEVAAALHEIEVGVNWVDGARRRTIVLHSVVEAEAP